MTIYDVTASVHPAMPVYPGDPEVAVERVSSIAGGSSANVSIYRLGSHTGTHVDPPLHFIEGGMAVDELPLDVLIGPALVVESGRGVIDREFLESAGIGGASRVIFKTGNSGLMAKARFHEDFTHLSPDAAAYLVELGVRLAGIDYLSIERFKSPDHEVHKTLLGAGVVVLEGLDLSGVKPGEYELICLPLKVKGGDGAPARVVLRRAGG